MNTFDDKIAQFLYAIEYTYMNTYQTYYRNINK